MPLYKRKSFYYPDNDMCDLSTIKLGIIPRDQINSSNHSNNLFKGPVSNYELHIKCISHTGSGEDWMNNIWGFSTAIVVCLRVWTLITLTVMKRPEWISLQLPYGGSNSRRKEAFMCPPSGWHDTEISDLIAKPRKMIKTPQICFSILWIFLSYFFRHSVK